MRNRTWRALSVVGLGTLLLAVGLAGSAFGNAQGGKAKHPRSKAKQAKIAASIRQTPVISRASFRRARRGRVVVRYRVRYPRVGRSRHDTARARLAVLHPRGNHALVRLDKRGSRVGRVKSYRFVVRGAAARVLRAAGAGRSTAGPRRRRLAKLVDLSVVHARDLWRGRRADHRRGRRGGRRTDHLVGAVSSGLGSKGDDRVEKASRRRRSIGRPSGLDGASGGTGNANQPVAQASTSPSSNAAAPGGALLGGIESAITFDNQTGDDVALSVAGFQCVYDNRYDATLRALNGQVLGSGQHLSAVVTERASGKIDPDGDAPNGDIKGYESPEVRSFLTQYSNMYASSAHNSVTPLYGLTFANLGVGSNGSGSKSKCGSEKTGNAFILGITGSRSRLHVELVLTIHTRHDLPGCGDLPKGAACFQAVGPINPGGAGVGALTDLSQLNQSSGAHTVTLRGRPFPSGSGDPTVPAEANGQCQPWNWMTCVFRPGKSDQVRLFDVLWPGTHDSGTYALSAYGSYHDSDDKSDCSGVPNLLVDLISATVTQRWAVTQRLTFRQQLELGIRYLDLRAAWNPTLGDWSIVHTMFSPAPLSRDLSDIAQWARAHPDEVLFVNLGACRPTSGDPHQQALEDSLRNSGMCSVTYPDRRSGPLGNHTLADIRASKNASGDVGNVVLLGTGVHGTGDGPVPGPPWSPGFVNSCNMDVNDHSGSLTMAGPGEGFPGPATNYDKDPTACADMPLAARAAATMASVPHDPTQSTYTIENYKSATNPHDVAMIVNPVQWGLLGATRSASVFLASGCPHSLLDYGKVLLPGSPLARSLDRPGLITGLRCGNIVIADNFSQTYDNYGSDDAFVIDNGYVKQIIGLNQTRDCPVDVFLQVSATMPAHSTLTYQLPTGATVDPVVPITKSGDITVTAASDNTSFTLANNTDKTATAKGDVVPVTVKGWPGSITITGPTAPVNGASVDLSAGDGPVQHSDGGAGQITLPAVVPGPGS